MGARPSTFRKGGGYLNDVDATIVGYTFEVGDTAKIKKGNRKGEDFTSLSFVPQFEIDGDDESKNEPKTQRLLIGDAENFGDVSDDGLTLSTPDGQNIGARSEAGIFITSLVAGGFDEALLSDSEEEINYEPIIGTRVRLMQEIDAEKTKRQGKQKGKDGKEYDRRNLLVSTVHDLPVADKKANGKAKAGAKASTKVAAKSKGKAADEPDDEQIEADGAEFVLEMLADAPSGKLAKSKLRMGLLKKRMKYPFREALEEKVFDDAFLASVEGMTYNKKTQTLALDE